MKSKQYVEINELLKTGNVFKVNEYLFSLWYCGKKVSKQCHKMLIDFALEKENINTISLVIGLLGRNASRKTLEELTNRIIETDITDYMCELGCITHKISLEIQDKLIDAIISSNTKAFHEYNKSGNPNAFVEMLTHLKYKYINKFSIAASSLKELNVNKLAECFYSYDDLKDICKLLKDANLPKEQMQEIEKIILESYNKSEVALFLKDTNNTKLISLIYGDENLFEQFLTDDKECNRNVGYGENKTSIKGVLGAKKSTESNLKNNIKFPICSSPLKMYFSTKYKFVDDNIQNVLNGDSYFKKII